MLSPINAKQRWRQPLARRQIQRRANLPQLSISLFATYVCCDNLVSPQINTMNIYVHWTELSWEHQETRSMFLPSPAVIVASLHGTALTASLTTC